MMTTPAHITADIRRLCRIIRGLDEPEFVEVMPRSNSGVDNCFIDVRKHATENGGSLQHGWMIWEWPGISAEGVFHAVWRRPDGRLLDITKKQDGERRILFAPDPKRVFADRQVGSIRIAIGRDPRIREWIDINDRLFRILRKQARFTGIQFETEIVVRGEAYELRKKSLELQRKLMHSSDARRATGA